MGIDIQHLLMQVTRQVSQHSETPLLDAQVLLAHTLGKPRSWVLAHPEAMLTDQQSDNIFKALKRLKQDEPLPYVIGHWEFFGLDFSLTPDVLIPRPETELLVERALYWLHHHPGSRQVVDIGTGSGCIGIALAVNNPGINVLLTDASLRALNNAKVNAEKYNLANRLSFQQADLLVGVNSSFDLICANLPYVPRDVLMKLPVAKREPLLALDGGKRGLELIAKLLSQARDHLAPGGMMLLEVEASQGGEVLSLTQGLYPASEVMVLKDLSGYDRCVEITPSNLIVHLCPHHEWLEAKQRGAYSDNSLTQEGFIHCSRPDQLLQVANRYYRAVPEMKVLWIESEKLTSEIHWETSKGGLFPHVYGPINLPAVAAVTDLQPDEDGNYRLVNPPD